MKLNSSLFLNLTGLEIHIMFQTILGNMVSY